MSVTLNAERPTLNAERSTTDAELFCIQTLHRIRRGAAECLNTQSGNRDDDHTHTTQSKDPKAHRCAEHEIIQPAMDGPPGKRRGDQKGDEDQFDEVTGEQCHDLCHGCPETQRILCVFETGPMDPIYNYCMTGKIMLEL